MPTILIIEDEPELVRVLRSYLEQAGFSVLTAYRGDTGLSTWENHQPDLVILDLNLPGMDGLDVARAIRHRKIGNSNTPILMLTARVDEIDQLLGLEIGADDYVTKPYSPRLVVSRVRAILRRVETSAKPAELLRAADLEIDLQAHQITRAGQVIDLTPTEFNLLAILAAQPGRTYSRLQLLEQMQGVAFEGYERTIDAHIKNLRLKIEMDAKKPRYIETVFGIGYRFKKE
jgi:two-component system, OmpR family, alkaline phosphatase synthesis response regulator PhoP